MAVPHMLRWTLLLENPYVTLPRSQKEKPKMTKELVKCCKSIKKGGSVNEKLKVRKIKLLRRLQ